MKLKYRFLEAIPDRAFHVATAYWWRYLRQPELRRLDRIVPNNSVAVDVGAWWGPWTYWLSRRATRVISFEPQPRLAAALRKLVRPNVEVLTDVLSDRARWVWLSSPEMPRGMDALVGVAEFDDTDAQVRGDSRLVRARASRLDDHDLGAVGFLKIDVEGHEHEVLEGALHTLQRDHPTILIELELDRLSRGSYEAIVDLLHSLGYEGMFLRQGAWHSLHRFDPARDQHTLRSRRTSTSYINNFLFVHETARCRPDERAVLT